MLKKKVKAKKVSPAKQKKPPHRPSDFTNELGEKICAQLSEGLSLRTVCLQNGMPDKATVFRWLRIHETFRDQYARAKEEATDAMAEEILDIANESLNTVKRGKVATANARVQALRIQIDTRKWIMSKMKPKKYGDKLDLTNDGDKFPTPIYGGKSTAKN